MLVTASINAGWLILSHVSFRLVMRPVPLIPSCKITFALSMGVSTPDLQVSQFVGILSEKSQSRV